MAATLRDGLPLLTIDMDGVICRPPFGRNLGIHRDFLDPDAPPIRARVPSRWFKRIVDPVRFELRRPLPGAREALDGVASDCARCSCSRGAAAHPIAGCAATASPDCSTAW